MAPERRPTHDGVHRGGMEHRGLQQVHRVAAPLVDEGDVVGVEQLGPLVEQHPLGHPGGAAGVHEDDRVGLLAFGRQHRPGVQQLVEGHGVGHVTRTDAHHVLEAGLLADGLDHRAEHCIDEADPGVGVAQHVDQLTGGEAEVEGVDDAASEGRGVVQLQVLG